MVRFLMQLSASGVCEGETKSSEHVRHGSNIKWLLKALNDSFYNIQRLEQPPYIFLSLGQSESMRPKEHSFPHPLVSANYECIARYQQPA